MTIQPRPIVLLLRSPSNEDDPYSDDYVATFKRAGFDATCVPILQHQFVNVERFQELVSKGPVNSYDGVIVTSGRAAEAWRSAAGNVDCSTGTWEHTPFYVVGEKTAGLLVPPSDTTCQLYPSPDRILGAKESGNAQRLAHFIVNCVNGRKEGASKQNPLLYLTGDKNRETVTTILHQEGISIERFRVYETKERTSLENDIQNALRNVKPDTPIWIAFFAPSSTKIALPLLQPFLDFPTANPEYTSPGLPSARFAAIGPTTHAYLSEEHPARFRVGVTAKSPTPEALLDGIQMCD